MTGCAENRALTDERWTRLEPLIEECRPPHKTKHHNLRRTIAAIIWRHKIRCAVAGHPGRVGSMVDGRTDLPSLGSPRRLETAAGTGAGAGRRRTGDDLSRRHQYPGAPQSRRC